MNHTEKQLRAINTDGKRVLVSAAAGSGKTSVLAKRVAQLVENGTDIQNMLVMTFTNAAATEMRLRIAKELFKRAEELKDSRLKEQSELASVADICTFHSFCTRVVRENYIITSTAPDFRIMADKESAAIRSTVLRMYFDMLYEKEDANFLRLLRRYTKGMNDRRLMEIMLNIYNGMMGQPMPYEWALKAAKMEQGKYIAFLKNEYEQMLTEKLVRAKELADKLIELSSLYSEKWTDIYEILAKKLEDALEQAKSEGLAKAKNSLSGVEKMSKMAKMDICKEDYQAYKTSATAFRDEIKEIFKEFFNDKALDNLEDIIKAQIEHTRPDVIALIWHIAVFGRMYSAEKKRLNLLDYEDLQHKALLALQQNGELYKNRYKYVFVDEYQDTNPVQEEIVSRIIHEDNMLFMVGDIKQSIYRFRLADPGIFRKKAQAFRQQSHEGEIIVMNDNFRSSGRVIDAVNDVMGCVMSEQLGEVDYNEEESLNKNKEGGEVRVLVCYGEEQKPSNKTNEKDSIANDTGNLEELEDTPEELSKSVAQAEMIANSIEQTMAESDVESPLGYGDIAILLRSRSRLVVELCRVLDIRGIPCVLSMEQVKDIPEVELFVNLLRLADNRLQDVPLLAVMRSFVGGFTEVDFAAIRQSQSKGAFHIAAWKYADKNSDELADRLKIFADKISELALLYSAMPLLDFIKLLAEKYGFYRYISCAPDGGNKRAIFDDFLALSAVMCEMGGNSLFGLLRELDEIKKQQGGYVKYSPGSRQPDCVKIMTIHGSKGLEFPVVYIVDTNKGFSTRDTSEKFFLHSEYGITAEYVDEDKRIKQETVERIVMKKKLKTENLSEELRMLYVAMTRAKEKLFVTGYVDYKEVAKQNWEQMKDRYDTAKCMLDWVMCAAEQKKSIEVCYIKNEPQLAESKEIDLEQWQEEVLATVEQKQPIRIEQRQRTPAKVSVSAIKREQSPGIRSFLKTSYAEDEEITGAELGTLMHSLMERIVKNGGGIELLLSDMLEKNLINEKELGAIKANSNMAERFLSSPLYSRIKASKKVLYEQQFNIRVSSEDIGYSNKGNMMVQGIIDLAFLEDDKWILLDYKTDRVAKKEGSIQQAAEGYRVQLELYTRALEQITGIEVSKRYLYFMRLGQEIEV